MGNISGFKDTPSAMIEKIPLAQDSNRDKRIYVTLETKFWHSPAAFDVSDKREHMPGVNFTKGDKTFIEFEVWCREDLQMALDACHCLERIDFAPFTPLGFLESMFLQSVMREISYRQQPVVQRMLRVLKKDGLLAFQKIVNDPDKLESYDLYVPQENK
jgi:hypothetical protein